MNQARMGLLVIFSLLVGQCAPKIEDQNRNRIPRRIQRTVRARRMNRDYWLEWRKDEWVDSCAH